MNRGTLELIIISFPDREPYQDHFEQEVESVQRLRDVRLVDHLFLHKLSEDEVVVVDGGAEASTGALDGDTPLHRLLCVDHGCIVLMPPSALEPTCTPGVRSEEVREMVSRMKPGQALGLALFEQLWSDRLVNRLKDPGGVLVDLSPLSADDLELLGEMPGELPFSSATRVNARDLELECAALVDVGA